MAHSSGKLKHHPKIQSNFERQMKIILEKAKLIGILITTTTRILN
jgi:hypothetical protein